MRTKSYRSKDVDADAPALAVWRENSHTNLEAACFLRPTGDYHSAELVFKSRR